MTAMPVVNAGVSRRASINTGVGAVPELDADVELTAMLRDQMAYAAALDLRIVRLTKADALALAQWSPERTTTSNVLHGGYLMGCADAIGAAVAYYNLPKGSVGTTTIESKTNFFRAVRSGTVQIRSAPIHVGATTVVVQTDIVDDRDRLVCRTIQTQLVLRPHPNGDTP